MRVVMPYNDLVWLNCTKVRWNFLYCWLNINYLGAKVNTSIFSSSGKYHEINSRIVQFKQSFNIIYGSNKGVHLYYIDRHVMTKVTWLHHWTVSTMRQKRDKEYLDDCVLWQTKLGEEFRTNLIPVNSLKKIILFITIQLNLWSITLERLPYPKIQNVSCVHIHTWREYDKSIFRIQMTSNKSLNLF